MDAEGGGAAQGQQVAEIHAQAGAAQRQQGHAERWRWRPPGPPETPGSFRANRARKTGTMTTESPVMKADLEGVVYLRPTV